MFHLPFLLRTATRVLAAAGTGDPGAGGSPGSGASSTPSGTPAGSPPATSGTGTTGSEGQGTGDGSQPTNPAADDIQDGNWKQLRTKYNEAQARLQAYGKLGDDPAKLEANLQIITRLQTQGAELAKGLGYSDEDFAEAFAADPEKTLNLLRQQAATQRTNPTANQPGDGKSLEERVAEMVAAQTKPFNDHINRQMTEAAMTRYGNEFKAAVAADPVLKDAPTEVHDMVRDYLEESLVHNPQLLEGMKMRGDFGFLKDQVALVAGRLNQVFTAWLAKSQGRTQNTGTVPGVRPPAGPKKPTLDDIIDNPAVLGDRYKA